MKKLIYSLVFFWFLIYGCTTDMGAKVEDGVSSEQSIEIDSAAAMIDSDKTISSKNWEYSEKEDEMTGKKTYYAMCKSDNTIEFDFPYSGGSTFWLVIRKKSNIIDVYVTVSSGQFLTSFNGSTMRIKFDDEEPGKYSYSGASDGSADVIFLNSESKLITKLKKAKKVSIEPEFYQAGLKIVNFTVEGLELK